MSDTRKFDVKRLIVNLTFQNFINRIIIFVYFLRPDKINII